MSDTTNSPSISIDRPGRLPDYNPDAEFAQQHPVQETEVEVTFGLVYRVHISLPSDKPGYLKVCPMAEAFGDWAYEKKMLPIRGTMATGPSHFIADFPIERQEEIEAWIRSWYAGDGES